MGPFDQSVRLATPPTACVVPDGVFDAFGWCASDELEWRRAPAPFDDGTPIDGRDPARMVFVMHARLPDDERAFLPRELARLHATGLGLRDEDALAPWAIDDAADGLYARRRRPRDVFWLAADNLNALFWGLHDWSHFHNHGPFVEIAWTELQCDASALAWLWQNRSQVPIEACVWERVREEVESLSRARFAAESLDFAQAQRALTAARLQRMAGVRRFDTDAGATQYAASPTSAGGPPLMGCWPPA
jgi:hypothetical protein